MMGFGNMKMFLSLAILYFLLDNGLGAPSRGRYMWLKCHPNGLDPNCVKQRGPVMDISGLPDKLPAAALKDLMNENAVLDLEVPMEVAKEQKMEEQEEDGEVYEADPEEHVEKEVFEADPEEQEEEVYEADPEEQEEEEVLEADPEEQEEEEVYEADPEEQEEEEEVYEADPEEQEQEEEEEQAESVPDVMEPGERPAEEGSAAGPFLNEEGSGEQWADSSSYAVPEERLTGPAMPPVQEMREEHLIV